jgi:putative tricarboxylic transport membrane protein
MTETDDQAGHGLVTDAAATRSGRAAAVILLAGAALLGFGASQIEFAFSSDPLGPRAFPYILAIALGVFSLWYLIAPGAAERWPSAATLLSSVALIAVTAGAMIAMPAIGFVPAAALMCAVAGYLFGAGPGMAIVIGVAQAAFWFVIFKYALGTYLPLGTLIFRS